MPARTHARAAPDALKRYGDKRDFSATPEPRAVRARPRKSGGMFVIQKHWASRLHYDFRLELDGVLLSWAVPKGPSFDPKEKRLAVHVEDHPVSYGGFEGTIPPKQYGAGEVIVWDHGTWEPVGDPRAGMAAGKLVFRLHGEKLAGLWELVRIADPAEKKQEAWLLFKKRDEWARASGDYDVVQALPESVVQQPLGLLEARTPAPPSAPATPAADAGPNLAGAVKAALPQRLSPQLATLTSEAPKGSRWLAEPKYDGYRLLCRLQGGKARLFTRNGHDWTARMMSLAHEIEALGIGQAWLDGEIVVFNEQGMPDFNALQNALDSAAKPRSRGASPPSQGIVYFVFDLPFLGDHDLRAVPLESRRAVLGRLFEAHASERVRFSPTLDAPPGELREAACRMNLEGIMLKRRDAPYVGARSDTWLKLKCTQRQEFVICGFTDRSGAPDEVGSLLLGYHEAGQLRYAGNVGTGWDTQTGAALHRRLVRMETGEPVFDAAVVKGGRWSRSGAGRERWVKPELVAEVAFAEWTPERHVRQGRFIALRTDKPPRDITRELQAEEERKPKPARGRGRTAGAAAAVQAPQLTHPERVIDASSGLKKADLFRYYDSVAQWILPHLRGRPVSLLRAPDGIAGTLFFQKHPESRVPGLTTLDPALWPGHAALLAIDTPQALLAAAQMNVVEIHTWNSTTAHIDLPDRVVFDLDPGEGVGWSEVAQAAWLVHALLEELGLQSWLKTSGGKGLHVVVPLKPSLAYDAVKDFSHKLVLHLARTIPSRFVAKSGPANRRGKIFVDYLRNGWGQTTVAAFSVRARKGLGVSMPVGWDELDALTGGSQWTIATALELLRERRSDPWAGYVRKRQSLVRAIQRLAAA